jgi:hypothetical protein
MAIKMSMNKMASEEAGREEHRKFAEEARKLKGVEKYEVEISVIKARIKNVECDIKHFGESDVFLNKIKNMEKQIEQLKVELEECRKNEGVKKNE